MSAICDNNLFLNIHLSEKESFLLRIEKQLKEGLFYMFFILLKNYQPTLLMECISIILQYIQFMYFPFDSYVKLYYLKIYSLM